MISKDFKVFVYVIELNSSIYYTGITNNLFRRLKEHVQHKSKFTSRFVVRKLKYIELLDGRKEARKLEVKIKRTGAKKYITRKMFEDRVLLDLGIDDIVKVWDEKNIENQIKVIESNYIRLEDYR